MDTKILDVLEEALLNDLELTPDLGALEAAVTTMLHVLGQGLLQRVVRRQPNGYEGPARACSCGERQRFVEHRSRTVHTTFGWIEIPRAWVHVTFVGEKWRIVLPVPALTSPAHSREAASWVAPCFALRATQGERYAANPG